MVKKLRGSAPLVVACVLCAGAPWVAFAEPAQSPNAANPVQTQQHTSDTSQTTRDAKPAVAASVGRDEDPTHLHSVVVTRRAPQSYRISQTSTATGTDTPIIDVPQSIQVIPEKVLQDQAVQSLAGAIRNAPGVYVNMGEGNTDEFYIRGVKTKSDFFVDGLRDDTEYFRDLYNVAHVDVLQGPAAVLFGRGGAGGIINLVTKQAEPERIRQLTFETGSYRHLRGTADVGDAIGQSGAFRLLAMAENSGGYRENYYLHRYAVNPKFSFQLGDRTQLDFGASYLDDQRLADRGIPSQNGRPADVPRDEFFGSVNQNFTRSRVGAFNLRIQHQFNDHLKLRNAFRVSNDQKLYQNAYPASAVDALGQLKLKAYHHPSDRRSYIDRAELVANFDTGVLQHELLAGSEFGWQRDKDLQTLPTPGSKTLPGTFSVSDPTVSNLTFPFLDRNNRVIGREFGVYAQDQVSLGQHWIALLGVRWDRFAVDADYLAPGVTPNQTHRVDYNWSPRAGLIYKPVENDSIYASVTRAFTPQGANIAKSQKSPKNANLAPEQATNYEVGNKLDLFDGKLSITTALFQLDLNNVVSNAADGSGQLVNTGKQRNRGLELAVEGALTPKWSVYANYTYLDAEYTQATQNAKAGARVELVPRNQFSVWTSYALTQHWGVGAGLHGASKKFTSFNNEVVLPGYAVADAMAYYQADSYRIQVNLNNITDKTYYPTASGDNQITPGAPISVIASLSVNF